MDLKVLEGRFKYRSIAQWRGCQYITQVRRGGWRSDESHNNTSEFVQAPSHCLRAMSQCLHDLVEPT
eukprot:109005-Amphidinium_carterae.3